MMDAGSTITRARKAAGLTQAELARRAGTRQSAISEYESGIRDPTVSTFVRLIRATGYELVFDLSPQNESYKVLPETPMGRKLASHRSEIRRIVRSYGGSTIGVFGSVARGDDDEHSDLDLLVDIPARTSMLTIGSIARDIGNLLGIEVDVVPEVALRPDSRDRILSEVIPI